VESLREHCNKLTCQLDEIKNKSISTISTQTENIEVNDNQHEKLNKHTQVIQTEKKERITQTEIVEIPVSLNTVYARNIDVSKSTMKTSESHFKNNKVSKSETLTVGSSILQRIVTKGLSRNTKIRTYRGATTSHIKHHLEENTSLNDFQNFILQVGGNDASQGREPELIECEYTNIIQVIRGSVPNANIFLSECPPRRDVNVNCVNSIIRTVAKDYKVDVIKTNSHFLSKNGHLDNALIWRDGIHLTNKGTATLVKLYNNVIPIIKENVQHNDRGHTPQNTTCFNCGENGHNTRSCRHGMKVQCWCCGGYGHKARMCWYREWN